MHHKLKKDIPYLRKRVVTDPKGTVYFNAANVPRVEKSETGDRRSFSLVTLSQGKVASISQVWLNSNFEQLSEEILYASAQ